MSTRWQHLPGEAPKKRRYEEDSLHIKIVYQLRKDFPSLLFLHPPNGGARNKREGAKLKAMGVLAGTPDLLFWWGEYQHFSSTTLIKAGAIEIKTATGRLSPEQETWRDRFKALGGKWEVCRSYDEVRKTLIGWGVKPT